MDTLKELMSFLFLEGMQALTIRQKGKSKYDSNLDSSQPKPQSSSSTSSSIDGGMQQKKTCKYCRKVKCSIDKCRKNVKHNV